MINIEAFFDDFFAKYPQKKTLSEQSIDYSFFENSIPIILREKERRSGSPKNLNIFAGFGMGRSEIKHCSLLSWLFAPSANHDQGELFFSCFAEYFNLYEISTLSVGGYFTVSTEDSYADSGRVDIMVSAKNFLVLIEAKVDANEQPDQIARYRKIINNLSISLNIHKDNCKIFFLTLDGHEAKTGTADFLIRWSDISSILLSFSAKCTNDYLSYTAIQYSKYISSLNVR